MAKTNRNTRNVLNTEIASMTDISEAIESVATENRDNLSETQAELVNTETNTSDVQLVAGDPETVTVDETVADVVVEADPEKDTKPETVKSVSFDALKASLEAGDIDNDILLDHVEEGNITSEQFTELTGVEYVGRDDSSDFQNRKMTLETRLSEGKLNHAGAFALVDAWLKSEKISADEANKLRQWLGSNESSNPIKTAIIQGYKPTLTTLDEIKIAGATVLKDIIITAVEVETSKVARLTNIFADYAYMKMMENKLPVSPTISDDLWSQIKVDQVLGEVVTEKDDNGAIIGVTDPYSDPAIRPLIKPICMKACLLAYGEATHVQFGYIRKEHAKSGRLNSRMVFETENGDENAFLRAVCVPANVILPHVFAATRPKEVVADKSGKKASISVWRLTPVKPNEDSTLRYLTHEVAAALYGKYFRDEELIYDTYSEREPVPTGAIIGSGKPTLETASKETEGETQGRETGGSQSQDKTEKEVIAEQARQIKQLETDLRGANEASKGDLISALNGLGALVRDTSTPFPVAALTTLMRTTADAITRRIIPETHLPSADVVLELARLTFELEGVISWDASDGTFEVETCDGSERAKYDIDLKNNKCAIKGGVVRQAQVRNGNNQAA